jgi:hypothetical protein
MASDIISRGPTIGQVSPDKTCRISSYDAVKQIVQRHGVLGLWTGSRLHLARDTIGTGVYFGVYESTKMTITTYRGASQANTGAAIAIAGCLCGILSWCLVSSKPVLIPPILLGPDESILDIPFGHNEDTGAEHARRRCSQVCGEGSKRKCQGGRSILKMEGY